MKKNYIRQISESLASALLKGLAVFAVFGVSLYAYAVNYPPQPNAVSGVVGLYVGQTGGSWDGNLGGYSLANNLCAAVEADSHVCTPMEIVNTYNHNDSAVTGESGTVWLNSGAPANTTPAVNDCNGWQNNSLSYYGNVWSFDSNDFAGILPCGYSLPVACCK